MNGKIVRILVATAAAIILSSSAASALAADARATGALLAASDHTCAITATGGVVCWGDNSAGGLGNGTTTSSTTPVAVTGLVSGIDAIAAGDRYSCALTHGGGVKCWGYNEFGQLGDGTTTNRSTPVDVTGLASGVTAVVARGEHTCALIADGLKCWGANLNGQLGDGTTANSSTPVGVTGLATGVGAVTVGGEHTCALTSVGGVKCWGWNATGQLGIGTTTDSTTPVEVTGLASDVDAIAGGGRHTCALMAAGGVKCWGYDEFGQLGDGATTDSPIPVDATGITDRAIAIATGGNLTCALRTGGAVTCWGIDLTDQGGNGGPVEVAGLASGTTSIVAGFYHVCGITPTDGVTCWGGNDTGQLGNGTLVDSPTPVDVRLADGTPLLVPAAQGDVEALNLLPIGILVLVASVVIVAGAWSLMARRRAR